MSTEEAVEEKLPNMAESRSSAERRAQVHRFHALIVSFVLCRTQQLQPWRYIPPRDIATSAAAAEVKVHTMESSNSLMVHVQDTFSHIVHSPKKKHKAHTTAAEIRILCHAKVHQRSLFSTSRLRCTMRIRL